MTDARKGRIESLCIATVAHLFACMYNPKYRGPNFSGKTFHEMAGGNCSAMLGESLPFKTTEKMREFAQEFGQYYAVLLVKKMTE